MLTNKEKELLLECVLDGFRLCVVNNGDAESADRIYQLDQLYRKVESLPVHDSEFLERVQKYVSQLST